MLAGATFEQDINLLLSSDACYLLLEDQDPAKIDQKNIRQMMRALGIYGVETVYIDETDAYSRNIPLDECTLATSKLSKDQVSSLVKQADIVIRF